MATSQDSLTCDHKALQINLDETRYGTFAEIGAGQEVARYFFQVGRASNTVAKTMSAYDMTFSDSIYGKGDRYVSLKRVQDMLDHEYKLLIDRLGPKRGEKTCFFAFADTVATSRKENHSHGWLGLKFQTQSQGPVNQVILHAKLKEKNRLLQQEVLGTLGVNLIYACFYCSKKGSELVSTLMDNLSHHQVEIDFIKVSGPQLDHIDNRILSLEIVRQGLTNAVLFNPQGEVLQASDSLYGKAVLVQRGTFRPITQVNLDIMDRACQQLAATNKLKKPIVLTEITMHSLQNEGEIDQQDFLNRIDLIAATGHHVLISDYYLFYQLKSYLRKCTDNYIAIAIGALHLAKIFSDTYYTDLNGGILKACGTLFDEKTQLCVSPYKSELLCTTAKTFSPPKHLVPLYSYLIENNFIIDISNCDDIDTSVHSSDVRQMLNEGNSEWEELVPKKVKDLIKRKKLFGYSD